MNQNSIYFKQVQLLIEVLPYVTMGKYFALKGGTAVNLFIRDLPRLFVDIDLMYLPIESKEVSLKNIKDLPSVKWKQINLNKMDSNSRLEAIDKLKKILNQ